MKLRGALLLVVTATVCALSGLFTPQEAAASVDVINQWPAKPTIASNSNTAAVTGTYTVGAGVNRLMLVAVAAECTTAPTGVTVTYGGQALTAVVNNTAQANKIWLYRLNDAGIVAAGANKSLSVSLTGAGTITSIYASASVYAGVNQTTPITGSNAASKAAAGTTLALSIPLTANAGITGNTGLAVYVANWDGATTSTAATGYTEIRDYQGVNSSLAYCYKVTTGTTTEAPTSTGAAAVVAAAAGVSLNPVTNSGTNYATVTTCGDCHGNPPDDGTARNTPPGLFPGAHGKHSGSNEGQYGQVCTVCHKNNGSNLAHADGFKNITGTGVPRNTYGGTTNVAVTDVTFSETCTKSTCHSSGRTTIQYAASPVWSGTTTCLSCHGGRSTTNPYPPARSANNFSMSTSHSQHLKYLSTEINCQTCHGKIAASHTALKDYTGAIYHGNGSKNVNFTQIAYGSYTSYKSTASGSSANTKVCTNTSCHGGSTRNAWRENAADGGINANHTCTHCHGVTTGVSASLAVTGTNRYNLRYFAPGWGAGATKGTSTDQTASSNNIRVGSHFKHLSSAYMRSIKCNECHKVPSTPFSADTNHTLNTTRFNSGTLDFTQASSARILIGVASGSTPAQLAAFAGYTNGTAVKAATCSSVYCHGNRLKTADTSGSYKKPYWNYSALITYGTPNTACGTCHGNPPTAGTSTTTHSGKTPTTSCNGCHANTVDALGKIKKGNGLHINGQVEASGGHEWSFGGLKHKNGGTGSITANPNTYTNCTICHSLTGGGSYPVTRGVAANINCQICHTNQTNFTSTPGCGDCHGLNATGVPNGAASAFPNWSGSHTAHIAQTYACADCHANGGSGNAIHGNYSGKTAKTRATVNIGFNTAKSGTAITYTAGTMTCGTSLCHGQKSPDWGQVVPAPQCLRCHGNQALATLNNYTQASIAPGTGNIDTNRTTGVTARGGAHQQHLTASLGITDKIRCVECHVTVTAVNQASHLNYTTATVTFTGHALDHSRSPSVARTSGIITCNNTGCHAGFTGTGAAAPTWNSTTYLSGTAPTGTLVLADCQKCHAFPPTPGSGSHATVAAVTAFPIGAQCGANCHANMNTAATTYATIFANKSLHMNGNVEGGDCISCHGSVQGGVRAPVVGQFASQSHHVQGAEPLTKATCYKCHWEADINGNEVAAYHSKTSGKGVSLVVWNGATTRPTTATAATLVSYTANGSRQQISKLNAVCLGCHNSANIPAANMFGTYASDQYSPEPKMVPALGKTSILSRYSSTRTVPWSNYTFTNSSGQVSQYGTNKKNIITKAVSAHGNAIKNQFPAWDATANGKGEDESMADIAPATLGANRNVLCYDCHNSHGSDAAGITSSYSSATGRYKGGLLKSTIAGQGGYTVTYKPAARTINYKNYSTTATTAALFNSGASICNDCHNNDTRKVNISRPWSITGTYSSTKAIVGYWSTPYFDNYTVNSVKRMAYKAGGAVGALKDMRKPMGGHYGSSVNGTQGGHSGEINGLCTPCHDPHGVSSAMTAVNRGKSVPLLKGTWVTSPYREDGATPVVKRGGGRNYAGAAAMGAMPGYNIDQNTLINQAAVVAGGAAVTTTVSNKRAQAFTVFPGAAGNALALHTEKTPADFAGLCIGCHNQASLTNATAPAASNWMSKERVHQSVAGWAATTGTNANGTVHAYTCSKCHTPHVAKLPRLLTTNCLDVRHVKRAVSGGSIAATAGPITSATSFGNIHQSAASSAYGAGRFPAGGSRYSGTPTSAQNNGPWYFQTVQPAAATYGSNCHNATNAGGATYDPTKQIWNKKTRW